MIVLLEIHTEDGGDRWDGLPLYIFSDQNLEDKGLHLRFL